MQSEAQPLIERLRSGLRGLRVAVGSEELSLTASFGVAERLAGESYSQTLNRADAALLEAKNSGRDRCVLALGSGCGQI
ncbi:diguanylate cyclase [compost metagenome]